MRSVADILAGTRPLIVNVPHDGREIPAAIGARMTADALALPDTDWHMRDLYDFAAELGATIISARYSRYVVDLNRDPSGKSLYPGADTTEICPTTTFRNDPIYVAGAAPNEREITRRIDDFWRPYHAILNQTVKDLRDRFGFVLLFDAHSIGSELPRFFDGRLPDFNFGTVDGTSADPDLAAAMFAVLEAAPGYSAVLNGRFKGGYITRHYGAPADSVHAVQLEIGQAAYMEESAPFRLRPDRAAMLGSVLRELLEVGRGWIDANGGAVGA